MKTKIAAVLLLFSLLSIRSMAQQPPNVGFENWVAIGTFQNPAGWASFNNFYSYGVPEMSFKTSDFHFGASALKLISQTATVPPPLGSNTLDTLAGFVFLGAFDMNNPGITYSYRPQGIQATVKGTIVTGGNALIIATLRKWNYVTKVRDQVGLAVYNMSSSMANYTKVSAPFTYYSLAMPDTLEIKIMAGDVGPGGTIMPGNIFFVDDILLTGVNGITNTDEFKNKIRVFPNPIQDNVTIHGSENITQIEIYTIVGAPVSLLKNTISQPSMDLNLSCLKNGIYFLRIHEGSKIYNEKIVKE
ncbi:MAG: T9SS type A sorting domain-containing protein [Bacteroidetes bacterium]|nr:T9SS type A sorting domain-containing protein [Bacteroidota bacterium]